MAATKPPPKEVERNSSFTIQPSEWTPEQVEVIREYRAFARSLGHRPKRREVEQAQDGIGVKPSIRQVKNHFGTVGNLQRAAGFSPTKSGVQVGSGIIAKEGAIRQLQALARRLRRKPTSRDVDRASKRKECPCTKTYQDLFEGKFNNALQEANLLYTPKQRRIIKGLRVLARILGRTPTAKDATAASRSIVPSVTTIQNHFDGKYNNALRAARLSIIRERETSFFVRKIPYVGICADCGKPRFLVMRVDQIQGACQQCYRSITGKSQPHRARDAAAA